MILALVHIRKGTSAKQAHETDTVVERWQILMRINAIRGILSVLWVILVLGYMPHQGRFRRQFLEANVTFIRRVQWEFART